MSFLSLPFFLLLAVAVTVYYCLPKSKRWGVLLAASYLFYLFAGAECLLFILYTTVVTYVFSMLMDLRLTREKQYLQQDLAEAPKEQRKAYRKAQKQRRFLLLTAGLLFGIGMLAVMKYTGFVVSVANDLGAGLKVPSLLLPMGISFYTFQSMGYLIDVYKEKARAERNFLRLALFVSFFPQLLQGPISRFGDLAPQLTEGHDFSAVAFRRGILRMLWGFFLKVMIADTAMVAVKTLIVGKMEGVYTVLLILLYSAVIYGDFKGGIDITIGVSELFGIRLKENFDRPLSSKSVREYWKRWHVTMGEWFTDYVFYPLSLCQPMQKFSKWSRKHLGQSVGKRLPVYVATVVTWFLTGLWHGAGWNFIVWGLLNCFVLLLSQELEPLWRAWRRAAPNVSASRPWGIWQAVRTFLLMGLIRSLDCYRDVPTTFRLWGSILTTWNWGELFCGGLTRLGLRTSEWILLAACILFVFVVSQLTKTRDLRGMIAADGVRFCAVLTGGIVLILLFGTYGIGYNAGDFIYGQF